ncbi:MAG: RHS repeat domain-containing protein, partial [Bacteroidia bacterium]
NVDETADDKDAAMPPDSSYTPDERVSLISAAIGQPIGVAKALIMMEEESVDIDVRYFFEASTADTNNTRPIQDILSQLAGIFLTNPPGNISSSTSEEQIAWAEATFIDNNELSDYLSSMMQIDPNEPTDPNAFLVWLYLDEHFNFIPEVSGVLRADQPDVLGDLMLLNLRAPAHGYLYVYVTNESNRMVSFDNFQILHSSGLLMQENHYYPYGMLIEGLSNAGTGLPKNMYRYTDKEAQNDLNQNLLDFGWRQYDPVIARWHVTDPAEQFYNPYLAIGANPVSLIDPDGRKAHSGMSGSSTKPFDMVLPGPDMNNGFGGRGGGNGMGKGSLNSLNPYDTKELANASGTAIINQGGNLCVGCSQQEWKNGTVVIKNTNTGQIFYNSGKNQKQTSQYGYLKGEIVKGSNSIEVSSTNPEDGYVWHGVMDEMELQYRWVSVGGDGMGGGIHANTGIGALAGSFGGLYGLTSDYVFKYGKRLADGTILSNVDITNAYKSKQLKVAGALGKVNIVTGTIGAAASGAKAISDFNEGGWTQVNGWDVSDALIGGGGAVVGFGAAIGIISNPIGWGIGIGVGLYFGGRLIYDLATEP